MKENRPHQKPKANPNTKTEPMKRAKNLILLLLSLKGNEYHSQSLDIVMRDEHARDQVLRVKHPSRLQP